MWDFLSANVSELATLLGVITAMFWVYLFKLKYTKTTEEKELEQQESEMLDSIEQILNKGKADKDISPSTPKNYYEVLVRNSFSLIKERLNQNIIQQNNRASFNLILSLAFSSVGIILMFAITFGYFGNNNVPSADIYSFLERFLPKLSMVVIIETVSFYFLKLYKSSLDIIQSLNNELINLTHRIDAVYLALMQEDENMIKECISAFIHSKSNNSLSNNELDIHISADMLAKLLSEVKK